MSTSPPSFPLDMWIANKLWKTLILPMAVKRDGSFSRMIADFMDPKASASEKPANGICSRDVIIDKDTDLWVRIFFPSDSGSGSKSPVIFYVHGGFFAFASPSSLHFDRICRKFSSDCNAVVISINYRRIPEHRYPAAIDDCSRAIRWSKSPEAATHLPGAADLSNSFLVGDSAGGNLVHGVSCKLSEEEDLGPIVFRGRILVQPSIGGRVKTASEDRFGNAPFADERLSEWRWKAYLPEGADKDHLACDVLQQDFSQLRLPPSLVIVGGYCPGQDRQIAYVEKMKAAGKEIEMKLLPDAVHAFFLFPKNKLALEYHEAAAAFIKSHW